MMRILITGSEGYIGTVLGRRLLEQGYEVEGVDALFYPDGDLFAPGAGPATRKADTRLLKREDLDGFECVVHLAELSNDPLGELSPRLTEEINIQATLRLAALAREAGVRRWIQLSSCSVYGCGDGRILDERSPVQPLTAYAAAKSASEAGLRALCSPAFAPVLLRGGTMYGVSPRIRLDLVANQFAAMGLVRKRLDLASDGTPVRPMVHVLDACEAVILAMEAPQREVSGETFNLGADDANYTVREIAETACRVVDGCEVRFGQLGADRRSYRVSFARIRERLGFCCRWTLEAGIRSMVEQMRKAGLDESALTGPKYFRLARLRQRMAAGELDAKLFERGMTGDEPSAAGR